MTKLKGALPGVAVCAAIAAACIALAGLPVLKVLGPLTLALVVGIALRATLGLSETLDAGSRIAARPVLRVGVALMGVRLDFAMLAAVGPRVLILDVAVVVAGLLGIMLLARKLGVPEKLGTLLAVGTSICGASAAVAAGSVIRAEEDDVTLAVGLCGILGTTGVLLYVFAAPLLGLTAPQLGVLSGSTLHEVAQVMAAAFTWGPESGDLGTLVKLTRVVLLAPALIVLGLWQGHETKVRYSLKEPPVPWFVIGFLAFGVLRSTGVLPANVAQGLTTLSAFLMATAMAAMGLHTQLQAVRRAGLKVIWAGLGGFLALAALAFGLMRALGI